MNPFLPIRQNKLRVAITAIAVVIVAALIGFASSSQPNRDPSGKGAEAATANSWGKPVDEHHFAKGLDGFTPYNSEGKTDYGLRTPENVSVDGGVLSLHGEADGHTGAGSFQFSQEYGRWEARLKAASDGKCWRPVALLWPDSGSYDHTGEIDYAESNGSLKKLTFFLHYPIGKQDIHEVEVDQTQWHNYAVEWKPDHVTGYIDGKPFWNMTNASHVPNTPFHATFQLDAQEQDAPCLGNNAIMQIDWLKVYK